MGRLWTTSGQLVAVASVWLVICAGAAAQVTATISGQLTATPNPAQVGEQITASVTVCVSLSPQQLGNQYLTGWAGGGPHWSYEWCTGFTDTTPDPTYLDTARTATGSFSAVGVKVVSVAVTLTGVVEYRPEGALPDSPEVHQETVNATRTFAVDVPVYDQPTIFFTAESQEILAGGANNATDRVQVLIRCVPAQAFAGRTLTVELVGGGHGSTTDTVTILGSTYTAPLRKAKLTGDVSQGYQVDTSQQPSALSLSPAKEATVLLWSSNKVGDSVQVRVHDSATSYDSAVFTFSGNTAIVLHYEDQEGNPTTPMYQEVCRARFTCTFRELPVVGHSVFAYLKQYTDSDGDVHQTNGGNLLVITQEEIDEANAMVQVSPLAHRTLDANGQTTYQVEVKHAAVRAFAVMFADLVMQSEP